uniref:Uncharacterized protein n=1 Tax=Setaria digitata TaxID=48799 RepID=A0A915PIP7_9BILA
MDLFPTIEDPRHTPGKRHGYAKEQLSPHAFSNNNQKSLFSSFITTPPVVKSENHFSNSGYNVCNIARLYQNKQQKQEQSNYPSRKSAFMMYRRSENQKPPEIDRDPPSIIGGDTLNLNHGILRPRPRYAAMSLSSDKNSEYAKKSNNDRTQVLEVDIIVNGQKVTTSQQEPTKISYSESGRSLDEIELQSESKKVKDLPRLKNFKNILNTFRMASDRALRHQQQRERIRRNASAHESDRGFTVQKSEQSTTDFACSERDYRLTKNKYHQHLRPFTVSIPTAGKNIRNSIPKQWIIQTNGTYVNVEPPSPTMSDISSIPASPSLVSSSPNRKSNSKLAKDYSVKGKNSDNNSHQNEPKIRQPRCVHNVSHSRPASETEARSNQNGTSYGCVIRCTSTDSYRRLMNPAIQPPTSESQNLSSETDDEDSASVTGLYKQHFMCIDLQMTANHLELLKYASSNMAKFFVNRNLIASKADLHKLKLDDLIFESLLPIFSKCSTHFFNAFLPHDGFLSSAINAEPIFNHSNPVKNNDLSVGNIWNPPTILEIKAHQDEAISKEYEQKLCFILLQLVCALKFFQLNGIEAISDDLSEFILLCRYTRADINSDDMDHLPRILLLQESFRMTNRKPTIGLCDYGLKILSTLLNLSNSNSLTNFTFPIQECARALQQDKSSSLTEAKSALEFGIFAGQDASSFSDEEDVQAWIDSKRADYVNYLVTTQLFI